MKNTNEMEIRFDSRSENEGFARVAVGGFLYPRNFPVTEVGEVLNPVCEAGRNVAIDRSTA